jgi:hypothetical protein
MDYIILNLDINHLEQTDLDKSKTDFHFSEIFSPSKVYLCVDRYFTVFD